MVSIVVIIFSFSIIPMSFAHQSGCHRWHSCPSDSGSYVCGDLGYDTYCPKSNPPKYEAPKYTPPKIESKPQIVKPSIPDWIKNNAKWWSGGQIKDSEFLKGIEYLVKENIIKVKNIASEKKFSEIPSWIKNNAKWWSEGKISEGDFLGGIQYLVSNGLINVGNLTTCDMTLWDYVYDPSRLKIVNDCTSVSGTIASIRVEADGDYHIGLTVDSQYQNLINEENIQNQHGNLVLEVICQKPVKQDSAIEACSNYSGHIDIPNIGDHVIVTGSYVLDLQHGGWAEIHPVSKFEVNP